MKQIVLLALLLIFLAAHICAQETVLTESQQLSRQIATLYQQGKFDEAIPLGEKAVEIEKKSTKNSEAYAVSLLNLALLHKERMRRLRNQVMSLPVEDRQKNFKAINSDAAKAEELMRDSLKTYQQMGLGESLAVASLKYELAWLLSNHRDFIVPMPKVRDRIDEAEELYGSALAIQEKNAGNENDLTLRTVLALGDFYTRWINFEKALPFYERYIAAYEKKSGAGSKILISALRATMEIFVIADRQTEAQELAKRIESLTGRPESLPVTRPNLALRAKNIERVKSEKFVLPERANDISFLFSQAYGIGSYSMMGTYRVRSVAVNIVVDEKGDVIEARADSDVKNKQEIEEAAMRSKFRPFSYKGNSYKMRGTIMYGYFE